MNPYKSPTALKSAVKARAQQQAKVTGLPISALMDRFYYQRLLARIFRHDPGGWMLKGGQALLVRFARARQSRDIDLYRPDAEAPEAALDAFRKAAALDLGDGLAFSMRGSTLLPKGQGVKLKVDVLLGSEKVHTISIDLMTNLRPLGEPERVPLEPVLPADWPDDWPDVVLYPLTDHVADKICAMYESHPPGLTPSSRFRDLADLLLIAQQNMLKATLTIAAIQSEQSRRQALGGQLDLPAAFTVPDPNTWPAGYRQAAAAVPALNGCADLEAATPLATAFMTPLLDGTARGQWNPTASQWS
ncbi:nucleotidyl transferase AbiEii/AbiGii toxin family protein [Kitasatospora sp. NPDC050543]|uniref:nucleotidyl transferase AbiEii/AbiGii toxin family protein n=1 Tax=Kitasatospora sp. NPDC050543 TaxID=3364054 RepID=UPI0037AF6C10